MSGWLLPGRRAAHGAEPESTLHVDPDRDLAAVRRRWEVRSAEWRALALAESIFGGRVEARLQGGASGGRQHFRGLLHLGVPFEDVELHRWRERVFRACAARDPLLSRIPFVFVFDPSVPADARG